MQPPSSNTSSYEDKRRKNIERNAAVLQSLGLSRPKFEARKANGNEKAKKNVAKTSNIIEPVRRSLRNLSRPKVSYADPVPYWDEGPSSKRRRTKVGGFAEKPAPTFTVEAKENPKQHPKPVSVAQPSPDSSKSLRCDVAKLMKEYLGKELPGTGKAVVMATACAEPCTPRFNKYSGVVEWKNAIFIWVNVGGKDYNNCFLKDGRLMTWFAGSRHNEFSPVIQRVLQTQGNLLLQARSLEIQSISNNGRDEEAVRKQGTPSSKKTTLNSALPYSNQGRIKNDKATDTTIGDRAPLVPSTLDQLLLFCRLEGQPYVFCGRLAVESYNLQVHPLEFVWKLLDFESLHAMESFNKFVST